MYVMCANMKHLLMKADGITVNSVTDMKQTHF